MVPESPDRDPCKEGAVVLMHTADDIQQWLRLHRVATHSLCSSRIGMPPFEQDGILLDGNVNFLSQLKRPQSEGASPDIDKEDRKENTEENSSVYSSSELQDISIQLQDTFATHSHENDIVAQNLDESKV